MAESSSSPIVDERELQITQSSGVRPTCGSTHENDNGKTCHQCRQKVKGLTVSCKNHKGNIPRKHCLIHICAKCLLNRYGEKASEVEHVIDWKCPKCRGICNCSVCMKKKGEKPTGQLVKTAKESGFASVSHMLQENSEKSVVAGTDMVVTSLRQQTSKEIADEDVPLPQGVRLNILDGVEISPQDIGDALQFLEFCTTFEEVFHVNKEQANFILKELMCGKSGRGGQYPPLIQLHFQLSSLILEDSGEKLQSTSAKDSWLDLLWKCVMKSKFTFHKIPNDIIHSSEEGYESLNCSMKLKLLNFLCDEALSTKSMRSWIDNQNSRFLETTARAKKKVLDAKKKEKTIKQQLKDVKGTTVPDHEDIVSKLKDEMAEARKEIIEANDILEKSQGRPNALRTEPILTVNGCALWRLKGYSAEPNILLQDLGEAVDIAAAEEKWFAFSVEQKLTLEKYILSRKLSLGLRRGREAMEIGESQVNSGDHATGGEPTTEEDQATGYESITGGDPRNS